MPETPDRKILILDRFSTAHVAKIAACAGNDFCVEQLDPLSEEKVVAAVKEAEIIVGQPALSLLQNPEVNCPRLKYIQMLWAGTDIYTRSSLPFPKNVMLSNATGVYGLAISQFVVCQILSLMLHFKEYHNQQNKKIWERRGPIKSLDGATVLIFGAGDIGSTTARRLSGFGTHTIGVCRNTQKQRPWFNELCTLEQAEKFLPKADVVICCIPNTAETEHYFDENRLKLMKQDAILVNVGRGNFVDCMALNEHLCNGHLWGAALDVTTPEPLPPDHPLWENQRCIITPHTSGVAFGHLQKTEDLLCELVCENIQHYRKHEELKNRVI